MIILFGLIVSLEAGVFVFVSCYSVHCHALSLRSTFFGGNRIEKEKTLLSYGNQRSPLADEYSEVAAMYFSQLYWLAYFEKFVCLDKWLM